MLTGSRRDGETGIRQQQDFDSPVTCLARRYPPVVPGDIRLAAQLGEKLNALAQTPPNGGPWRLFRILHIYVETRTITGIFDRLHQYCRCIDGLILSDPGKGKRQFRSRTKLFIGPHHHDMMGEVYEIRSNVEYLHENRYLEHFDREIRLNLAKKEAIIEHIARTALARILSDNTLSSHFANTLAIIKFWRLEVDERQRTWGDPINPQDAISAFNPTNIHDGQLGAS